MIDQLQENRIYIIPDGYKGKVVQAINLDGKWNLWRLFSIEGGKNFRPLTIDDIRTLSSNTRKPKLDGETSYHVTASGNILDSGKTICLVCDLVDSGLTHDVCGYVWKVTP